MSTYSISSREEGAPSRPICYLTCTSSYVLPASSLPRSIIRSTEGVWNVSVIAFSAFFMQQVRRQTARQSVYSVWEHAGSHGQTEKEMDGDVLLAERIIRSTDMKIKGGQGSTAPPPKCLRTKNISVLLTYDPFGNPDGRVLSPLSV